MHTPRLIPTLRRHLPEVGAAAVIVLTTAIAALLAAGADNPSWIHLLTGRLHPLVVHLPIGFLLLAVILEILSWRGRFARLRHAVPVVLVIGASSAIVAVLAGHLLGTTGGYSGATVDWHRWLGIGVAIGSVLATGLWYLARSLRQRWLRPAYLGSLFATVGLLAATGHLGGTLTHGPGYLTEHMPPALLGAIALLAGEEAPADSFVPINEITVYQHLVEPVLQSRCVSCHGPDKQQGELRLDSPEALLKGGDSGPVVQPGRPAESELIRRIWLPASHEDHMPPRGREQLTPVEGELLRWWVDQGAPLEGVAARMDPPRSVRGLLELIAGPPEQRISPVLRQEIAAADSAALAAARELGFVLKPIDQRHGNFLRAHCSSVAESCGDEQVLALLPLAEQITELDLRGSEIGDEALRTIGRLRHLTRLHLEETAVTDAGIVHLDSLQHLEYLNLYGTRVSDAALEHLVDMETLRSLFLWRTAVTPAAVERFAEQNPLVRVELGLERLEADSSFTADAMSSAIPSPSPTAS